MNRRRRLIRWIGAAGGGAAAGVALPFSDAFTYSDGALPSPWIGDTWTIDTNAALNTPVPGAEDVSNGNMETGDPPSGWTGVLSPTLDSAADERTGGSGSASLSIVNGGAAYSQVYQTLDAAAGIWMLINGWAKRMTSAWAQIILQTNAGVTLAYGLSNTADTWVNVVFSGYTSGANCRIALADSNTNNGEHRYDDISAKPLTTSELFATVPTSLANVTAQVVVTITPGNRHAGLVLNLDSTTNPLNYVVAHLGISSVGAMQARLDKCVNGVISNVIAGNVTYGATKYIKVVKDGNNYSLYYGTTDIQVGTTMIVASMNGTNHGLFSTGGAAKFDSFSLVATPSNP